MGELSPADIELRDAEQAFAHSQNPQDPQTPEEWMQFSRHLDARDRVRAAKRQLADQEGK